MTNGARISHLRRIYTLPRRAPVQIAGISLAILFEIAGNAAIPLGAAYLIDRVLLAHQPEKLLRISVALIGAVIMAFIAGLLRDRIYAGLQGSALANLRQSMYERLQQLSMTFHAHTQPDEIIDTFFEDTDQIERAFSMAPRWGALPLCQGLLFTGMILWLSWPAGSLAALLWPWILLASRTLTRKAGRAADECGDEQIRIMSVIEESLTARMIIRAFSLENLGIALFRKRNEILARGASKANFLESIGDRVAGAGILAVESAVLLLCVSLATGGGITLGVLVGVLLLTLGVADSVQMFAEYRDVYSEGRTAWARIHENLADPAPILDRTNAKLLPPMQEEVLLLGVRYQYDEEHRALTGVSVRVKKGSYVAFVGPSGSGKSTLLRLLMRFHDPDGGIVTIDGHDIQGVTQTSLRARMGLVLQENFVFDASLAENIRLGKPDTSEAAIAEIAEIAGIAGFASTLPDGINTNGPASGIRRDGEAMQRLALARALLRNPDLLLLDEVASALDAAQENSLNSTLRTLTKERTVVSATHRLSSAADADYIYVLNEGSVVEEGSHFELMAKDGFYAGLWRKQAGFRFSADGSHVDVDAERLKQFPILENLPIDVLADLAPYFATETFPAGRNIVCQNDPGDKFYIIARGKVEVWRTEEHSGETSRMAVLQDGDFFGEITLITGFPRTATVRTATVCTCISLGRGQFTRLIDRFPELRRELSEIAVQRLRESSRALAFPA